jgi:hypothetical protein
MQDKENMTWEVSFNQIGLCQYNLNNPEKKIDLEDAIILRKINQFLNAEGMNKKVFNGKCFVWVSYKKLLTELPSLKVNNKDSIARKIKHKLTKNELIEFMMDTKDNNKTYFTLTPIGLKTDTYRVHNRNPIGLETETLSDGKPNNTNTIYTNTKDKRELSLFDSLKTRYSDDIERIIKSYPLPTDQLEFCVNEFNSKSYKLNNVNCKHFERFISLWYNNNKNDKNKTNTDLTDANKISWS